MKKFEQAHVRGVAGPLVAGGEVCGGSIMRSGNVGFPDPADRWTDMTENITFPQAMYTGGKISSSS